MRQFDRSIRPERPDHSRRSIPYRLGEPATLVCAALMLALVMLSVQIASMW